MTPAEQEVLRQVDRLSSQLVELTRALVRVPTVNPPGDCYAVSADLMGNELRTLGYRLEQLPAEGMHEHSAQHPRINVVGTLGSGGPVLHFNGHYDVVPAYGGWTVDPFGAEGRDGRGYGRGNRDQKGGIPASIIAVEAVRPGRIGLHRTNRPRGTPREESGGVPAG